MSLDLKRFFLLEDDVNNTLVISSILRRNGAIVFHDIWGTHTVDQILRNQPIHLILLDLMLPNNASGYKVLESIREIPVLAKVPVVAITAADPDVEMKKAREAGFSGFISKPVRAQPFVQAMLALLAGIPVWGTAPNSGRTTMNFEGLHVLIIEDDHSDLDVLQSLLKRFNISSSAIMDSRNLTTALDETKVPNLIFLDLEIPGKSGYEVLSYLKSIAYLQAIPVIAYTSHLSEMATARQAGFHSFLGKPLKSSDFAAQLTQILNGQQVWDMR